MHVHACADLSRNENLTPTCLPVSAILLPLVTPSFLMQVLDAAGVDWHPSRMYPGGTQSCVFGAALAAQNRWMGVWMGGKKD